MSYRIEQKFGVYEIIYSCCTVYSKLYNPSDIAINIILNDRQKDRQNVSMIFDILPAI